MKKYQALIPLFALLLIAILANAQSAEDEPAKTTNSTENSGLFSEYDDLNKWLEDFNGDWSTQASTSNVLKSISIGSQTWTAENLDVTMFRNGDLIPEVKTEEDWVKACKYGDPAWCYYNHDPANAEKYGKLYNLNAVIDKRGLAPAGWHVPTEEEWNRMADYFKGNNEAAKRMKSTDAGGSAFIAGGYRFDDNGTLSFSKKGNNGYWWTNTEIGSGMGAGWGFSIEPDHNGFRKGMFGNDGLSVRCIKD